jgi:exopolysaccharide biosynthesis polyprenyl glycosylphosphotransferase
MIWRSSFNSKIAQIADFITVFLGLAVSYLWWDYLHLKNPRIFPQPFPVNGSLILIGAFLSFLFVLFLKNYQAYSYQRFTSLITEFLNILKVTTILLLGTIIVSYLLYYRIPRTALLLPFFVVVIFIGIEKTLLYFLANYIRQKGKNRKRVIIIGTGTRTKKFIEVVNKNFSWGLDILGLLTGDEDKVGQTLYGYKVLDTYKNIIKIVKELNPEEIIITISTKRFDRIREVLEICESVGIPVRLNSDFFGKITKDVRVDNLYGLNIISFGYTKQKEWQLFIKRLMDIIVSAVALILLSPIMLIIALLIYLQDGRPILYSWHVVGYNRKPIKSWKFRTMVRNADEIKKQLMKNNEMSGPVFKLTNDPRILPVGKFLRKYSLDELPQLFSVLKGDLSLVGPRPPLQYEFNEFDLWHRRKLSVKPGLTCLWQVSGRSKITDFNEWAKLDLEYIDNWSLLLDIKILLKTIPVVLLGKGAK